MNAPPPPFPKTGQRYLVIGSTDAPVVPDEKIHDGINGMIQKLKRSLEGQSTSDDRRLAALYFSPIEYASGEEQSFRSRDLRLKAFQLREFAARGIPIPRIKSADGGTHARFGDSKREERREERREEPERVPYLLLHQYLEMDRLCRAASLKVHQRDRTHTILHTNTAGVFGLNLRRIAVRRSFPFVASHFDSIYRRIEAAATALVEGLQSQAKPKGQFCSKDLLRDLFPFFADEPELLGPLAEIFQDATTATQHLMTRHRPMTRHLGRIFFWLGKRLNPYVFDKVEGGKAVMRIYQNIGTLTDEMADRYGWDRSSVVTDLDPMARRLVRMMVHRYLQWFYLPAQLVLIDNEDQRETLLEIGVTDEKIKRIDPATDVAESVYQWCETADRKRGEITAQIPHVQSLRDFQWRAKPGDFPKFKPFCTISDLHLADGDSFDRMEALAELYPLLDAKGVNSIVYNGDLGELSASRQKYQGHRNRVNWVRQSLLQGIPNDGIPVKATALVEIAALNDGRLKGSQRERVFRQMIKAAARGGLTLRINGKRMGILADGEELTGAGLPEDHQLILMDEVLTYGNHDEGLDLETEFPGIRVAPSLVHFEPAMGAVFTHGHIVGVAQFLATIEGGNADHIVEGLRKSNMHEALEMQEVLHDIATLSWRSTERAINSRWLWKHAMQPTVSRMVRRLRRERLKSGTTDNIDPDGKARFWESLISPADDVERCGMLAASFDTPETPSWVCCYGHSHVPAIERVRFQHPRTGRLQTRMVVNSGKFHGDLMTAVVVNFPEITIFYWSNRDKEWRMHMYECLSDDEVAEVLDNEGERPTSKTAKVRANPATPVTHGIVMHEVPTEGDGHITRFASLFPEYQKLGEVCTVLSGPRSHRLDLPGGVHHRCSGLRLHYNDRGGLDAVSSATAYFRQIRRVVEESRDLAPLIPNFQAIVSDFGPTVKLAYKEAQRQARADHRLNSLPELYSISHQAALESHQVDVPRPKPSVSYDVQQRAIDWLRGSQSIGFHYEQYNDAIMLPMIRPEIRDMRPQFDGDFILVYVRGEPDMVIDQLAQVDLPIDWRIYHRSATEIERRSDKIWLHPTSRQEFVADLAHCRGVFADAGFGITSESLHLGLPLVCRPVPNHLEQQSNAAALKEISQVGVIQHIDSREAVETLQSTFGETLTATKPLERKGRIGPIRRYPDVAKQVVERILSNVAVG